jgi:hypothetical protein
MTRPIRPIPQYPYAAPPTFSPPLFRPGPGGGFPTGIPEGRESAFTRVSNGGDDMPMDGEGGRERTEAGQLEAIRGIGYEKEASGTSYIRREGRSVIAKVADSSSAHCRHSSGGVELPAANTSFASKNIVEQLVAADDSMLRAADGSLVDESLSVDDSLLAAAARNLLGTAIFAIIGTTLGLGTSFYKFQNSVYQSCVSIGTSTTEYTVDINL